MTSGCGDGKTNDARIPRSQAMPGCLKYAHLGCLSSGYGRRESVRPCVSEEVDYGLGNGVKSRELASGDPCCREGPKCTYSVATGAALATLRSRAARQCWCYSLDSGLEPCGSKWQMRVTERGNRREHQPRGGGLHGGASAERGGGHWPPTEGRRAGARGAITKYKGAREVQARQNDTAAPPSRGVARGGAKDPTDGPAAEFHGRALLMSFDG
jgi:hypothetical protein